MVDGSRMPNRMAQPHGMPPYADAYQARMGQPARIVDSLSGQAQLGTSSGQVPGRSGGVPTEQEALEDLLSMSIYDSYKCTNGYS